MKKVELEKNKGLKINDRRNKAVTPSRFSDDSTAVLNRREQRKLDQERGLIPFAVKLNSELVQQLNARAQAQQESLTDVVSDLLQRGLEAASKG